MTLEDILGRGVQVEWHEAIAIVRDVIERGVETDQASIPELHDVELLSSGRVEVTGGAVVDEPVERLAQMLQTLIRPALPPVQFSQLMAEPQKSVRAFSESLAYFERPNRVAILQDLHNRATGSSPLPDADALIASLRAARAAGRPPASPAGEQKAPSAFQRRTFLYAAGILVLVGALAVALVLARRTGAGSSALSAKVSKGVAGVTDAVGSAVSSIGERVGLRSGTAQPPAQAPVEVGKPEGQTVATSRSPRSRGEPEAPAVSPAAPNDLNVPALPKDQPSQPVIGDAPPPVVGDQPAATVSDPVDATVYSASSPGVSAPVAIRPQLPKVLPLGLRADQVARMELVINPDGTVASVKLLGQPRNIHDSMLLSAAKAWAFRPATKDRTPVSYRMEISVAR